YIDDCFALVWAFTKQEALDNLALLQFDNCEIVWSADDKRCIFLDMDISLRPGDSCIHYKPYRKPQNSFERVPWASHHPEDDKRGTFLGEMTRLAALSSQVSYYEDALAELRDIYLARGYPQSLVNTWLRIHATERWKSRRAVNKRELENVHVLKTVFNP